jgi:hypothetical protein
MGSADIEATLRETWGTRGRETKQQGEGEGDWAKPQYREALAQPGYAQLVAQPEREGIGTKVGRQMGTAAQFLGSCNQ